MGMAVLDRMSRAGDGGRAEPGWFESLNPSSSSTTLAWAATGYLTWLCGVLSPLIWCLDCSAIHYIAASKHDRKETIETITATRSQPLSKSGYLNDKT
jgi:hypothetical protein